MSGGCAVPSVLPEGDPSACGESKMAIPALAEIRHG
jgi:hypothetical protein